MSYALFISRNDIIKQTPLQGSIDADRLLTFVRTAQDKYMLNLLGTVLFYYLQAQIEAGTIDQLPVAYQDLLNDHIKPTLIWYSVAEYLPFSNTQFKSEGALRYKSGESETVDKNQIDYLLQKALNSADFLAKTADVGLTDQALANAMKNAGIAVETTPVGDRYVLERMLEKDFVLGGEQSGHVIMRKYANTGDGLLTALAIAQEVARSKKSLAELASVMTRFPQILINVKGVSKEKLASNSAISDAVKAAETTLGSSGRVLLRASGTENLVRVMVEASSDNLASEVATTLADVVRKELSL